MDRIQRKLVPLCAICAVAFVAIALHAQQRGNNPPGDIKPAQSASPAANPTAPNNNGRNVIDRPRGAVQDEPGVPADRRSARDNPRPRGRADRGDREENLNRQLAACLLTKNKGEVELGNFAESRAKDGAVKEFAAQMVNDHSEVVAKLDRLVGSEMPSDRRSQIAREIDEQCLETVKTELSDKPAAEFDKCYIGSQIAAHMQMATTLKVLSQHATGELRDVITEAQPTVDKHLKHAKELIDKLEKSDHHSQASKDRSESKR